MTKEGEKPKDRQSIQLLSLFCFAFQARDHGDTSSISLYDSSSIWPSATDSVHVLTIYMEMLYISQQLQ